MGSDTPEYDVFISYSRRDADWVRNRLVPALEEHDIRVCIDYKDFAPGAFRMDEIERAVQRSRKTLLVFTPEYMSDPIGWDEVVGKLARSSDPNAALRRTIPLVLRPCELPPSFAALVPISLTNHKEIETELERLLEAVSPDKETGSFSLDGLRLSADQSLEDRILDSLNRRRPDCALGLTELEISEQLGVSVESVRGNLELLKGVGSVESEILVSGGGISLWRITSEGYNRLLSSHIF